MLRKLPALLALVALAAGAQNGGPPEKQIAVSVGGEVPKTLYQFERR